MLKYSSIYVWILGGVVYDFEYFEVLMYICLDLLGYLNLIDVASRPHSLYFVALMYAFYDISGY